MVSLPRGRASGATGPESEPSDSPPPARRRWLAGAVAGLLAALVGLPGVTSAFGADEDDLEQRRSQVKERLEDAKSDLGHSSHRLERAVARLEAAQSKLSTAKARLERTRAELQEAEEFDALMQQRLDAAKARLAEARARLQEGRAAVDQQRRRLAGFAAESFQSSENRFLELRVFLRAETPESLTTQMDAVDSIATKQSVDFAQLKASEVLLKVDEEEVAAAKKEVARQRAAAARNLERKKQLTSQAAAEKQQVDELVAARASAKREAAAAKQQDLAEVEQLESERAEIQERLEAIARRRAEALRRAREAERASRDSARSSAPAPAPSSGLTYPVNSYITSSYGMRLHPVLNYRKLHDGTDFGASCGTPVVAAAGGRVLSAYYSTGYGNQVLLDHGVEGGVSLSTSYSHLTSFAVSSGQRVSQGQVIGYAGTTGYSTGCHLHFMVYENGTPVDPMGWL